MIKKAYIKLFSLDFFGSEALYHNERILVVTVNFTGISC